MVETFAMFFDVNSERGGVGHGLDELKVAATRGQHGGTDTTRGDVALFHEFQGEGVAEKGEGPVQAPHSYPYVVNIQNHGPPV